MNEDGLVASITDGGSGAQGLGFSVILLLRYVLETCSSVDQAIAALSRIPIALSQNVTLLDRTGQFATVFLGPDREPAVSRIPACTNHQETPLKLSSAASAHSRSSGSKVSLAALEDRTMTLERLTAKFFEPPLYSRRAGFTTVYTAVYLPSEGRVDLSSAPTNAGANASTASWRWNTPTTTASYCRAKISCISPRRSLSWHIATFRCAAEVGHYQMIANID